MTPRERAEALGWVLAHVSYGAAGSEARWETPAGKEIAWCSDQQRWPRVGWWVGPPIIDGMGTYYPTEDEALAHALLLRDVVLS